MTRWFRWYEATTEDGKLRLVARKSRVTIRDTLAVWAVLLESAADLAHPGVCSKEIDLIETVLDFGEGEVRPILDAMAAAGLIEIEDARVTICNWTKRQFKSDTDSTAAERQKRKRERDAKASNANVTRDSRTPDTDSESDTDSERRKEESPLPPKVPELELMVSEPDECRMAFDEWNVLAAKLRLPKAQAFNDQRKRAIAARLRDSGGIEGWRAMLEILERSDWLAGRTPKSSPATLDWISTPTYFTRIMEGNYEQSYKEPAGGDFSGNGIAGRRVGRPRPASIAEAMSDVLAAREGKR